MAFSVICLITIWTAATVFSFNIDTSVPILKKSKNRGKSYFGYSVFPHKISESNQFRVLVGAPLDNMSNYMVTERPSGAVYSCPISTADDDCVALLMLKLNPNSEYRFLYQHQWLGVNVYSDTVSPGGHYAYTCAHRFQRINLFGNKLTVPGHCLAMHNSLRSSGYDSLIPLSPPGCKPAAKRSDIKKVMCLRGTALASRPDLGVLAIGAANEKKTAGLVHFTHLRHGPGSGGWNRTSVDARYGYAGYSVALGKVFGEETVNFTLVAGAPGVPRGQTGGGEVRLFAVTERQPVAEVRSVLQEDTFGSRFGQTLLTVDLNADGWDDVIVGAPDFEDRDRGSYVKLGAGVVGCGAVYVYLNEEGSVPRQRSLRRVLMLRPRSLSKLDCIKNDCVNARFGASLAKVGDLNMDGFQDVGIGAPGDGGGVVYIYHGHSRTGLSEKPSQVLVASSINSALRGFGTSVAGGLDLDGNRYPDIVIGAPLSGHAVILRTRPVIDVICSVVFDPPELDPTLQPSSNLVECGKNGRCLPAKIYLSYRHAGSAFNPDAKVSQASYPGKVTLVLDGGKGYPRIVFERGATSSFGRRIQLSHSKVMYKKPAFTVRLYIDPDRFIDKMNPISLTVKWELDLKPPLKPREEGARLPDLNQFPIYDHANAEKTFQLPWKMTCLQQVCVSKVKMRMKTNLERSPGRYIFYFGREDDFWLNFTVSNSREPAHKTILQLEFTNRLVLLNTRCPFQCKLQDSRLSCPLANPLVKGQRRRCSIHMSGSNIVPDTPRLDFRVSLLTVSDNADGARTNITFSASVQILADIRMRGMVKPEMVIYGNQRLLGASSVFHEKRIGPKVTFTFLLENAARSGVVPSSELVIYWPYEVLGERGEEHGKYLLYMIQPPFLEAVSNNTLRCDSSTWSDLINPNDVRLLSRYQALTTKSLGYISSGTKPDLRRYQVCSDYKARCRPIHCRVGHLSHKTGKIRIRIEARLWVHTMSEDFPHAKFVPLLVNVTWRPSSKYTVAQQSGNDTTLMMRLIASNMLPQPPRRPDNMWMLISLSVLAGVIILGCIILLLWKIKFFRRDRRVQEQRLAQQQQLAAQEDERHKYDYMEYD